MKTIQISNPQQLSKPDIEKRIFAFLKNRGIDCGKSSFIGYSFYAKKNDAVGVAIKISSHRNHLSLKFAGYSPSILYRILLVGIVPYLILIPKWKNYEKETFEVFKNFQLNV